MRYSQDLRKRVLDFIAAGGSKAEASRRFRISRRCIYNWLDAADPFIYEKQGFRKPYQLERDFANIKRKWEYNAEASIDEIIKISK
ncbi:MAG: IS630 transposase-related protein [Candidatus Poribacteria bacterium]|nr:IS630 transposase-related protein [Candidatus Poribacteria bacterium]